MERLQSFACLFILVVAFFFLASPADAALARTKAAKHPTQLGKRIAKSAKTVASSMKSVGYCFRGVKRALKKVGVKLDGNSAHQAKAQLSSDSRFKKVPMSKLREGDILVHGKSRRHPHGHIAVYLGNKKEASDHIGKLVTGRFYGGTTVFRPIGLDPDPAKTQS